MNIMKLYKLSVVVITGILSINFSLAENEYTDRVIWSDEPNGQLNGKINNEIVAIAVKQNEEKVRDLQLVMLGKQLIASISTQIDSNATKNEIYKHAVTITKNLEYALTIETINDSGDLLISFSDMKKGDSNLVRVIILSKNSKLIKIAK